MFNNIGKKIMGLAKAVCWLGIIGSCITGVAFMAIDEEMLIVGIPVALVGSFFSWLGSLSVYGFGKLIDNTDILVAQGQGRMVPPFAQNGNFVPAQPMNAPYQGNTYAPVNNQPNFTPAYQTGNFTPTAPVTPVAPVAPVNPVVTENNPVSYDNANTTTL